VNLSVFAILDMSQIKDLRHPKTRKVEKIHILYGCGCMESIAGRRDRCRRLQAGQRVARRERSFRRCSSAQVPLT
jgi:hypothetical protein